MFHYGIFAHWALENMRIEQLTSVKWELLCGINAIMAASYIKLPDMHHRSSEKIITSKLGQSSAGCTTTCPKQRKNSLWARTPEQRETDAKAHMNKEKPMRKHTWTKRNQCESTPTTTTSKLSAPRDGRQCREQWWRRHSRKAYASLSDWRSLVPAQCAQFRKFLEHRRHTWCPLRLRGKRRVARGSTCDNNMHLASNSCTLFVKETVDKVKKKKNYVQQLGKIVPRVRVVLETNYSMFKRGWFLNN